MGPAFRAAAIAAVLLALPVHAAGPCKASEDEHEGSCAQAVDRFAWDVLVGICHIGTNAGAAP